VLRALADPRQIAEVDLPREITTPYRGRTRVEAIVWSYIEDGGDKVHAHMIAPQVEVMMDIMGAHFADVEILSYPVAHPGWKDRRTAIVARRKKGV